jgi:hypothetical protein
MKKYKEFFCGFDKAALFIWLGIRTEGYQSKCVAFCTLILTSDY